MNTSSETCEPLIKNGTSDRLLPFAARLLDFMCAERRGDELQTGKDTNIDGCDLTLKLGQAIWGNQPEYDRFESIQPKKKSSAEVGLPSLGE